MSHPSISRSKYYGPASQLADSAPDFDIALETILKEGATDSEWLEASAALVERWYLRRRTWPGFDAEMDGQTICRCLRERGLDPVAVAARMRNEGAATNGAGFLSDALRLAG